LQFVFVSMCISKNKNTICMGLKIVEMGPNDQVQLSSPLQPYPTPPKKERKKEFKTFNYIIVEIEIAYCVIN
jgi:hypothetical protein